MSKTQEAKEANDEAEEDDLRKLTAIEAAAHLTNEDYEDVNGDTAVIPAGFAVSQVEGENVIDDGLVIIDKNGNEFVWVPVSQENSETEFVRRTSIYINGQEQPMANYGEINSEGVNVNIIGTPTGITESSITIQEAIEMYASVKEHGGFYIGRYEAGKESNGNVVIQKGANVYNNVTWSKNGQMDETSIGIAEGVDGTKDGAIELARNFDTANGYTTVTSTLCYGVQWDRTLSWIDSDYTGFARNSTGRGNYNEEENTNLWKGNLASTGSSENYKINNIYDLAGNVLEWTMENYETDKRVHRGR